MEREEDEEESGAAQADSTTMWVVKHVGGREHNDTLDVCLLILQKKLWSSSELLNISIQLFSALVELRCVEVKGVMYSLYTCNSNCA